VLINIISSAALWALWKMWNGMCFQKVAKYGEANGEDCRTITE
jgi:hypothetical protein